MFLLILFEFFVCFIQSVLILGFSILRCISTVIASCHLLPTTIQLSWDLLLLLMGNGAGESVTFR